MCFRAEDGPNPGVSESLPENTHQNGQKSAIFAGNRPFFFPNKRDHSPDKRDYSPDKRKHFPERRDFLPENHDLEPLERDLAPERRTLPAESRRLLTTLEWFQGTDNLSSIYRLTS